MSAEPDSARPKRDRGSLPAPRWVWGCPPAQVRGLKPRPRARQQGNLCLGAGGYTGIGDVSMLAGAADWGWTGVAGIAWAGGAAAVAGAWLPPWATVGAATLGSTLGVGVLVWVGAVAGTAPQVRQPEQSVPWRRRPRWVPARFEPLGCRRHCGLGCAWGLGRDCGGGRGWRLGPIRGALVPVGFFAIAVALSLAIIAPGPHLGWRGQGLCQGEGRVSGGASESGWVAMAGEVWSCRTMPARGGRVTVSDWPGSSRRCPVSPSIRWHCRYRCQRSRWSPNSTAPGSARAWVRRCGSPPAGPG